MNNNRKNIQMITKSLCDFIDAGISHGQNDIDKFLILTALALHIDKRSKEIDGGTPCQTQENPKKQGRLKKAMQKN
jgi:hypothetical protein